MNKKYSYYFILGNNPALSMAEIMVVLGLNDKLNISTILGKDFLIVNLDKEIDAPSVMKILGGTIKIGIIKAVGTQNFASLQCRIIKDLKVNSNKKFYFGFSVYGNLDNKREIAKLGMEIKRELKNRGVNSRWVVARKEQLSSVIAKKNKLISEQGIEWCFLQTKDKLYLGKTLVVQEFEDYSQRDYGRPARDAHSGMLPPKLAKMMVNLGAGERWKFDFQRGSRTSTDLTLLDPFCGSGTILQEAALLGIKKIIGSDLSAKAIKDAKQNLEWLRNKSAITSKMSIFQSDVKKLSSQLGTELLEKIDLIVTEPYLGSPLKGNESKPSMMVPGKQAIDGIIDELSVLYIDAFKEFKKILKAKGRISMIWPVFRCREGGLKFLSIINQVEKLGFKQINLILDKKTLASNLSKRGTIIYGRPNQLVWREIVVVFKQ
jgi:tRNA (guanine10-N2)-dimethyltransferase